MKIRLNNNQELIAIYSNGLAYFKAQETAFDLSIEYLNATLNSATTNGEKESLNLALELVQSEKAFIYYVIDGLGGFLVPLEGEKNYLESEFSSKCDGFNSASLKIS